MRRFLKFTAIFCALLLTLVLAACGEGKVSFEKKEYNISAGDEIVLNVEKSDDAFVLEWSSDNPDVAAVDSAGKIIGKSVGEAKITVSVKDKNIKATVIVKVTAYTGTLSLSEQSVNIAVDGTHTFSATLDPAKTAVFSWSSDDDSVAAVDANGKVTGKKAGTATITVSALGKTATATVTVSAASEPSSVGIIGAEAMHPMGTTVQLTARVLPTSASQGVNWSSSDEDVAVVGDTGLVEFIAIGMVDIIATSKVKPAVFGKVTIIVTEPNPVSISIESETGSTEIPVYSMVQFYAHVLPEEAQQGVTWSISDDSIASMNDAGVLYAANTGTITITAVSNVDETVYGTLEITISQPLPTDVFVTGEYKVIQVDEELTLVTSVLPVEASPAVVFELSNEDVVTIDENGKVTGIAPGSVVITVKTVALDTVQAVYNLKVVESVFAPDHSRVIFDGDFETYERYEKVYRDGFEYIIGVNAFYDLRDVDLGDDPVLFFYPGTYKGKLVIDKDNSVLKSLNSDTKPFEGTYVNSNEAVIAGSILLGADISDVTINGLSFTGAGKVKNQGAVTNFTFINNYIYDTDPSAGDWNTSRNYELAAAVALSGGGQAMNNLLFADNIFENVHDVNILVANITDLTIKNNVFHNFSRDAIRIDGGYNYGYAVIEDNEFVSDEIETSYCGIFFRILGADKASAATPQNVLVKGNTFENLGKTGVALSGAISKMGYQEYGLVVNVVENVFRTCTNYFWIRNNAGAENHAAYAWEFNVNFNEFYGEPVAHYHRDAVAETDTPQTNPALINMDYNFYGDAEGVGLDFAAIADKFLEVGSVAYTFGTLDEMYAIYVDPDLAGTEPDAVIEVNGLDLVFGQTAFATLADAVAAAEVGAVIVLMPGEYAGNATIGKGVKITSLNNGKSPNTEAFKEEHEAVIKGVISLAAGVTGVTIDGLSFTEGGALTNKGAVTNFIFANNSIYDTTPTSVAWNPARDYTLVGVINLWGQSMPVVNALLENNLFVNVHATNINIGNVTDVTVRGNVFLNFSRDAVRFDGGYGYGNVLVEDNWFENDNDVTGYNGIFFRCVGHSADSTNPEFITVRENTFKNIGKEGVVFSGAISTNGYQEYGVTINIIHNIFENCTNYIMLRNNATVAKHAAYKWVGNVAYNIFLGEPLVYYFTNHSGAEAETTNPALVNMNYNFYGDLDGEALDFADIEQKFIRVAVLDEVFISIDDLEEALAGGEEETGKAILVDIALEEVEDGSDVVYDGYVYVAGDNAFASLAAALGAAEEGDTILVAPGTYVGNVAIDKDGITLIGPNAGVMPDEERDEEAFIDGKVTLGAGVKDVTISGFYFNFIKDDKYVTGAEEGLMDGFTFAYNLVDGILSPQDGAFGFILFKQASADKGIKNFVINYNKFMNIRSDRVIRIAYIENLDVEENIFLDCTTDAVRINDNGGGVSGVLNISHNEFTNIGQFALFPGKYELTECYIVGNVFNNTGSSYSGTGAISFRGGVVHENGTYIEVSGNVFNGSGDGGIDVRFDHTAKESDNLEIRVFNNEFLDPGVTYYKNNSTGAVKTLFYNNKLYGENGELLDPESVSSKILNAKLALEAPTIYFVPELPAGEEGDTVQYDGIEEELILGVNIFADAVKALAALAPGGTLVIMPGSYDNTFKLGTDNVTVTTLNGELDPNGQDVRAAEAVLRNDFFILAGTKNVVLKGLTFSYYAQLMIQNNAEDVLIKNNIFREDYFNENKPAIDINGMLAWTGTYEKMVKNVTVENNLFDNISTREGYEGSNHTVRGIGLMFTENLIIRNNIMDGFGENYFYGIYGKALIENNEFLNCRYRALNLVNVMTSIDIMNNKFSMDAKAGSASRVVNIWYNGDWFNASPKDGAKDFYPDNIVVNVKYNEVVVDVNTVRVFALDPSVSCAGVYVYKHNYEINCNYNSVTGEFAEKMDLVFTDHNNLNAQYNYWGSADVDPGMFNGINIDYRNFFTSKEQLDNVE